MPCKRYELLSVREVSKASVLNPVRSGASGNALNWGLEPLQPDVTSNASGQVGGD